MITQFTLSQLANITHGKLYGNESSFRQISIDTRNFPEKSLYIALKGKNFDGHDYAEAAKEAGAIAILGEREVPVQLPQVIVEDSRIALGDIARYLRETYPIPTVAITGSNGKTTAKTMLTSIMGLKGQVLAAEGTMNNNIGLPLTLFRQKAEDDYAILELGMNHFGEISYLTSIAKPDIAVITLVGPAHLEALHDLNGVARAKGEIFQGLKAGGIAIVNADQPEFIEYFRSLVEPKSKLITFGLSSSASIRAENIRLDNEHKPTFELVIKNQKKKVRLTVLGEHNVINALAAAAVADVLGVSLDMIVKGLELMEPVGKRLNILQGLNGSTIIDDSYNAIPNAVLAAIDILASCQGEKIFAFGGMAELGINPEKYYREIGEYARKKKIDKIIVCDPMGHITVEAFGSGAINISEREHFVQCLKEMLNPEVTVLFKARRGFKMEEIVEQMVSQL